MIPVKVESYSGYKADEYPKVFYWNDRRFEIQEVLDRWYQGDQNPAFLPSDYFKVLAENGREFLLQHILELDLWYLVK